MTYPRLIWTCYYLLKSVRPRQWVKNGAVYAALLFSGFLFYNPSDAPPYFLTVTIAFLLFNVLTSSIYLLNDIMDIEADRHHPFKAKRPIASGRISVRLALTVAILGLVLVAIASFWTPLFFQLSLFAYFLLQLAYTTTLKHLPILDVASIATGFVLRVYGGAIIVDLHPSAWFLLTIVSASLFIAVSKRQSERTLLQNNQELVGVTRKILARYSQRLLDQYTSMFATATWLTYALFTFQYKTDAPQEFITSFYPILPSAWRSEKMLMATIPLVIFGVMRYLQLVYEGNKGESPDKVLFTDRPLLTTVVAFGLSVLFILYVLH